MDYSDPALISVTMPCHNVAPHMEEAVASVLWQRQPRVEFVAVDDGSSEILQRLAAEQSDRLPLVYRNRAGPLATRNQALVSSSWRTPLAG